MGIGGGLIVLLLPFFLAPLAIWRTPVLGRAAGWMLVDVYQPALFRLDDGNALRVLYQQNTFFWCRNISGCELIKEDAAFSERLDQ